ncbi:peptidyl-prolyl cis-trans isomerase [Desulfosarcina widdelii]|uniref:Peptidyl-prolyl cis-trans isomerase n=1 Tax=Desulfosarcina widdelii TaxID=947919 RepID=A0A5K7YYC1_9BACT|nr:peptidylprolyl isomerase [Desulfosarcina widdelii]BBO73370.1 peptidyl-prolyl cis-trans isomerase [Desulfosarcina widdelii]
MRRWIVLVVLFLSLGFTGIGPSFADETKPQVKLTTSMGDIVLELDRTAAPKTVANFLAYVKDGHYDGTIFHRVIAGFMIQGGGFTADMQRKPTRAPVRNEADNGLTNRTGTIAMARTNDPHSASAQFFINVKDNDFLDHRAKSAKGWGYCVFGRVVDGMNVVRAIENVKTTSRAGMRDVPGTPVVIEKAILIAG